MNILAALTNKQRYLLALAMTAITAAIAGPDPEDLAAAPALDLWRPLATLDLAPVLWGCVSGHPHLAPGPIVTSRLIALNRQDGWARTLSRWYRLAEPFKAFEGALARDAGLSSSGMRIMIFDSGGYIPVDDPVVLDQLLADHAACVALGCLHEVAGSGNGAVDGAAASCFTTGIAARLPGPVLWCVTRADLFAPGLEQAGLGPDRVIYVEAGDDVSVLACMEEGLRHGGLGAVVAEVARLSMTASRRLHLAAKGSGTTGIALRRWRAPAGRP